jgi:bifunctional non-homologous end joining protein LigD
MAERVTLSIDGEPTEVTSLSDLLFPNTGTRKGDVINYYIRISEHLLPHLQQRPMKLKLFWNGVGKPPHDERDAPPGFLPKWMDTVTLPRTHETGEMDFALVNNLRALVWLVNHKNYELHPFLATAAHLRRPTAVVFDLDPGAPANVLHAAEVALALKSMLDALKLQSFVKSSGGKGLHVYVPLNSSVSYEQTSAFARQAAEALEAAMPKLVVSKMAKAIRPGRVFVDWAQNEWLKSTVAVYSLRATGHLPFVSTPLTWREVERALKKRDEDAFLFTPEDVVRRIAKHGDLFAPVLTLKQTLPAMQSGKGVARAVTTNESAVADFIGPMECTPVELHQLPGTETHQYEQKHDGYRCLAVREGERVTLFSRNGNDFTATYPSIADALRRLTPTSFVLDGEIVAHDARGRESFTALQNIANTDAELHFHLFDVLRVDGTDVMAQPLRDRRKLLEKTFARQLTRKALAQVHLVKTFPRGLSVADLVRRMRKASADGLVAKRIDAPYRPGNRQAWVKHKFQRTDDFVIGGYIGLGWVDELVVGQFDGNGRLLFVEAVKAGFNPQFRRKVFEELGAFKTDAVPFANLPEKKGQHRMDREKMREVHWLRPELVAEIAFDERTVHQHLRHAKFVRLRRDKNPEQCRLPQP